LKLLRRQGDIVIVNDLNPQICIKQHWNNECVQFSV